MVTELRAGLLLKFGDPDWRSNALSMSWEPHRTICVFGVNLFPYLR